MHLKKRTIDSHIHIGNWFCEDGGDYVQRCDALQQALGLDGFCIDCVSDPVYGNVENNIMAALYKLHNPTAYANGAIVYASYPIQLPFGEGVDPLTQYEELMEIGLDGMKILYKPDVQKIKQLPIDHEVYEPVFAQMEKDGTHITWHVADPEEFWDARTGRKWDYSDGTYPSYESMMEQTLRVMEKHPQLKVTFAHFMFLSKHPEMLEELFEKYPNLAVDVTPGTEMYTSFTEQRDFYRGFFEKYAHRILFGSDVEIPLRRHSVNEELVRSVYQAMTEDCEVSIWKLPARGLELSDASCNLILRENFLRRSGNKPKNVNVAALKRYIQKYLPLIKNPKSKEQILKKFEELERW